MLSSSTPTPTSSWTIPRARVAGYKRRGRPDTDPDVIDARRELRAARLELYIARVVAEAPPLTPAMLDRLALLLRGGDAA